MEIGKCQLGINGWIISSLVVTNEGGEPSVNPCSNKAKMDMRCS